MLTSKRGNINFYKGRGGRNEGVHTTKGWISGGGDRRNICIRYYSVKPLSKRRWRLHSHDVLYPDNVEPMSPQENMWFWLTRR